MSSYWIAIYTETALPIDKENTKCIAEFNPTERHAKADHLSDKRNKVGLIPLPVQVDPC